jgi:hypothetical protein
MAVAMAVETAAGMGVEMAAGMGVEMAAAMGVEMAAAMGVGTVGGAAGGIEVMFSPRTRFRRTRQYFDARSAD